MWLRFERRHTARRISLLASRARASDLSWSFGSKGLGDRMTDTARGILRLQQGSQCRSDVGDIGFTVKVTWADAMTHEDERNVRVIP